MPKKILVVDDDPHIVSLIKNRFEANSYEVLTANDGEECIKKILSDKPDLVILDIMMPKVDGYNVLVGIKEIRAITGELPEIPIIVLTAVADPRVREMVEKEQIIDYMIKPFDSADLLAKVKKALGEA